MVDFLQQKNEVAKMSEHKHQCALFAWARQPSVIARFPDIRWLEGSINGVKLTAPAAMGAKRAGLVAGVHDVTLKCRARGFGGLSIELKLPDRRKEKGGGMSDSQIDYGDFLRSNGWSVLCCYGWDEARSVIEWYLSDE
jgi:hypothetical protein